MRSTPQVRLLRHPRQHPSVEIGQPLRQGAHPLTLQRQPLDGDGADDIQWYAPGPASDQVWWSADGPLAATEAAKVNL